MHGVSRKWSWLCLCGAVFAWFGCEAPASGPAGAGSVEEPLSMSAAEGGMPMPEAPASCGEQLLAERCSGCHSSAEPASGLDLQSPDALAALVGQPSSAGCDAVLVDAEDPERSLLFTKLSPETDCGSPMPLAGAPLTQAERECVLELLRAHATPSL